MTQPFAHVKALDHVAENSNPVVNLADRERIGSVVAGSALVLLGISRRSLPGMLLALAGGMLVHRGATGHCRAYEALEIDTAHPNHRGVPGNHGVKIEKTIVIHRSASDLFRFWRNLENVPQFMGRIQSVKTLSDRLSHWVAGVPGGMTIGWDAEIINEHPDRMIAWQSLPGSMLESAGSVWFTPHGAATEVKLAVQYHPAAGTLGDVVAKFLKNLPEHQIEEDLARLKKLMEG